MRIGIMIMVIATVAVAAYAAVRISLRNAAPDVNVIGGDVYDAGVVHGDKPVTHTFKIVNPHPFAVGLSAPEAGCSCTTASASTSSIPPHGAANVTLRVEPENGSLSGSASIITSHGHGKADTWLMVTGSEAR